MLRFRLPPVNANTAPAIKAMMIHETNSPVINAPVAVTAQDEVIPSPDDAPRLRSSSSHVYLPRWEQPCDSRDDETSLEYEPLCVRHVRRSSLEAEGSP